MTEMSNPQVAEKAHSKSGQWGHVGGDNIWASQATMAQVDLRERMQHSLKAHRNILWTI
jgi:hypothetical protein